MIFPAFAARSAVCSRRCTLQRLDVGSGGQGGLRAWGFRFRVLGLGIGLEAKAEGLGFAKHLE